MRRYGHLAGQSYWLECQSKRGVGREGRGLVSLTKGSGFILKISQESFQKEIQINYTELFILMILKNG